MPTDTSFPACIYLGFTFRSRKHWSAAHRYDLLLGQPGIFLKVCLKVLTVRLLVSRGLSKCQASFVDIDLLNDHTFPRDNNNTSFL